MDNEEANSELGLASRILAFAFVEEVAGQDWKDRDITKLQIALFEYGKAIKSELVISLKGD